MIEIIATSPDDAIIIEKYRADRIELISAFSEGGLTPSYGIIESTLKNTKIPVNVMIRPHSKNFVYTELEIASMQRDIEIVKSLGANGVVFGVLDENNEICEDRLKALLQVSKNMEVTFHKAFDRANNLKKAFLTLSKYPQIKTILTAGGINKIMNNLEVIKELQKLPTHIEIMLGGGLTLNNIQFIKNETNIKTYHFGTAARVNNSQNGKIDKNKLKELIKLVNN